MRYIIGILYLAYSFNCYCFNFALICDEPNGLRIDYYLANTAGIENNKFISSSDKISKASPMLYFSNNKALLILQDSQSFGGESNTALLEYVIKNEDQISMIGVLNKAPYLVSYYPKLDVLYFSTQRTMFLPGY